MDAIVQIIVAISEWLPKRFRLLLDRLPDRDASTLPWWHRLVRLTLAGALCLAIVIPLGWLILR